MIPRDRRALVVGDGSAAFVLPALRSLGRAGWTTGVGQPAAGLATTSRWCSRAHVVPRAESGAEAFVEAVADVLREGRYDVVFPADDIELLALSAARDRLPALVPYPPHDVVLAAVDKLSLTRAAEQVGLGVPRTREATDDVVAAVGGPVVVKARLHWSPGDAAGDRHLPVRLVDGPEQARAAVAAVRAGGGEPVLQELVEGVLTDISVVLDRDGRLVAASQQQTERTTLRRTSARARTVLPDPVLEAAVVALLRRLGWWGLANLQLLRGADGVPRLIDLNGRFYGSLALALALAVAAGAGADLPAVWAAVATGLTLEELPPERQPSPDGVRRARAGVRFQALDEDLLTVRAAPSGRGAGAVGAALYGLGAAHSVWDPRDPGPVTAPLP